MVKRKRSDLTEEDVGARIFPYDHESIIYQPEEDDGGDGGERKKRQRREDREWINPSDEGPPRERIRREGEGDRGI